MCWSARNMECDNFDMLLSIIQVALVDIGQGSIGFGCSAAPSPEDDDWCYRVSRPSPIRHGLPHQTRGAVHLLGLELGAPLRPHWPVRTHLRRQAASQVGLLSATAYGLIVL